MRTYFCLIAAAAALCALLVPGTAAAQSEPSITASLTEDVVWGGGFGPTAPVTVKVLAADDTLLETVTTETDAGGYFQLEQGALATDLVPERQVVVTSGPWTRELTLAQLTFDVLDPGTDVASGTAEAGKVVIVDTWPGGQGLRLTPTARADGTWVADFGAGKQEVGGNAAAQVFEEDGDATWASRNAPQLKAYYHYEFQRRDVGIGGSSWTPGATLGLEILSKDGTVLWSGSTVAGSGNDGEPGSFDYCCTRDALPLDFDIEPGMQLRATETGSGMVKEMTLADFSLDRLDPVANAATGTAPANADVWLNVDGQRFETEADATGAWHVQLPDRHPLSWVSWAEAGTDDIDGDWTGASAQPATIVASLTRDRIEGTYFSLGGDVRVDVLAGGTTAWTTTASTGGTRAISLDAGVDLVPGMTVRATDLATGLVKAVELVPLSVDVVDPVADRAAGTGSSGRLFGWQPGIGGGEIGDVVPAGDGTWSFVFPSWFDVTPATTVSVYAADHEADRTWAEYVAPVVAIPALEEEVPLWLPEELAKPLEEKLEGALASLGGTGGAVAAAAATTATTGSGGAVNVGAAINKLGAFVNQVRAYVNSRRIAPDAGARLGGEATRILVGLGG